MSIENLELKEIFGYVPNGFSAKCRHEPLGELHITPLFWEHGIEDAIVGIESTEDGERWIGIVIDRKQAEQIIAHLEEQFQIKNSK